MIRYVYVAGPLTGGDVSANVRVACDAGTRLLRAGFVPYVPHLSCFWETISPAADYEGWMALDFAWIDRCDALVRLPGPSKGADREVAYALERDIPVFQGLAGLLDAPCVTEVSS